MKSILIVKIGAIGDVVMALPLITEIRKKHPQAKITWLCGKQVLAMLERVEGIDELIPIDENKLLKSSIPIRILEIFRIWSRLILRRFDCQLYFYKSAFYRILTLPVIFKETRGFRGKPTGSRVPVQGRHHSTEYIRAFLEAGGPDNFQPQYPKVRSIPERSANSNPQQRIVFACGGAKNILQNNDLRRWPLTHYENLAARIAAAGHEIVLTGGPGDTWVRDGFGQIPHTDLIGKLSLNEFIDFLATADLLITHDSGPLHLADLAACPVLGLFGPTRPADFRSLQPASQFIWGGEFLSCRPCYDGKDYGRCSSNECLRSITPEEVFQKMQEMLQGVAAQ